jgi:hypothetical protein
LEKNYFNSVLSGLVFAFFPSFLSRRGYFSPPFFQGGVRHNGCQLPSRALKAKRPAILVNVGYAVE